MKTARGYRFGTLSDHALGLAMDIDPAHNAQIEARQWQHILGYTGRSLDRATRCAQWRDAPEHLHRALSEISELFVRQLSAALAATGESGATALQNVVSLSPDLRGLGLPFVRKWQNGFFNLPWELVKKIHEEGFPWGATFSRMDLHHFEL